MITPSFSPTATERVLPKLALDFTTASLDSRITFTRTTDATHPATYVGSNGYITSATNNQARFDYNPVTLACKGLLIEESRTNSFVYSEQFNNGSWSSLNVSVSADATTSPDGNTTADKWIPNNGATSCWMWQSPLTLATWTQSIFAKAAGFNVLQMNFFSTADGDRFAQFDLSNGTIGTTSSGVTAKMESYGNGWYRCIITYTMTGLVNQAAQPIRLPSGNTGDGVKGYYVWGAQVETGAFATSYIPTTTTALTRNADVATMTGTNFSDWWQASKSGVLVRARPGTVSGTRPWVQFDDGTANEIIALRGNTTNPELYIVDGGVAQAQIDAGTIAANNDYSLTGWWATNDCKARLDSGAVVTDTSATIPTVTQARLGSDGTNYLNGHLASISYYDSFSEQIYTRRKNKAVFNLM